MIQFLCVSLSCEASGLGIHIAAVICNESFPVKAVPADEYEEREITQLSTALFQENCTQGKYIHVQLN